MENYPYLNEAISSVIIRLRKEAGLSQQKLAEMSSLARVYLLQLEQARFRPTLNSIYHLAQGLGLTAPELVSLIEEERQKLEDKGNHSSV